MAPKTIDDFDAMCRTLCPQCRSFVMARRRTDTYEYVHDTVVDRGASTKLMSHSLCQAHDYRVKYQGKFYVKA